MLLKHFYHNSSFKHLNKEFNKITAQNNKINKIVKTLSDKNNRLESKLIILTNQLENIKFEYSKLKSHYYMDKKE